jgi:hypothetical protein
LGGWGREKVGVCVFVCGKEKKEKGEKKRKNKT